MKLPDWFKTAWWIVMFVLISSYLFRRYPDLTKGEPNYVDAIVFLVWIILAFAPMFTEIELFGVSVKQQIKEVKQEVNKELEHIRAEIRYSTDIRAQINPHFSLAPPPDSQLPALEQRIQSVVENTLRDYGIEIVLDEEEDLRVENDVNFLFAARYNLERELRRIWNERVDVAEGSNRPQPFTILLRSMVQMELIPPDMAHLMREVYSVCSPAIHGESVTEAKVAFVRNTVPELLAALRTIS